MEQKRVEGELDGDVEEVDASQGDAVDGHRSQGVEEDLEGTEESFSEDRVEDESFESSWKIGIEAVDAERLVMGEVVGLGIHQYQLHRHETHHRERTLNEAL